MASLPIAGESMEYEGNTDVMTYEDGDIMAYTNIHPLKGELLEYLPNYYKKHNSVWEDLAKAFYATTYDWDGKTDNIRNGYIFHLADSGQLEYLEKIFMIPYDPTLPLDVRAGRLMAKLVPNVTTVRVIKEIAKQFYPNEEPIVDELGEDYTITIAFAKMKVLPPYISTFRDTITNILQADLDFIVVLNVALSAFTHDELHAFTHEDIRAYKQSG